MMFAQYNHFKMNVGIEIRGFRVMAGT